MLFAFAICQPLFIGFPKRFNQSRPLKLTGGILCAFIVGQRVLRDYALELFPQLKDRL
jgi:hypothetical protein